MSAPDCPKCDGPCRGKLLGEAQQIAAYLRTVLAPFCERIEIAGSIRRAPDGDFDGWDHRIHDVELVAIPKMESIAVGEDLFGGVEREETNLLDGFVDSWIADGGFKLRPDKKGGVANGSRYRRLLWAGFPLDLFSVLPPAQWGVIFAIRTGPASFSRRLVTQREKHPEGLLTAPMVIREGMLWRHPGNESSKGVLQGVHTPEEADLFKAIGMAFVEPWERS